MKISVMLLATLIAVPALAADGHRYALEIMRVSTPWRAAPVSERECEAQARDRERNEARLARVTGESMRARCVKVND